MKTRILVCILVISACSFAQTVSRGGEDVVATLLPDGSVRAFVVPNPSEKARVIKQLKEAKHAARGQRTQQIAFLLAALDVDYQQNRDYLLWVLSGCDVAEIKNGCNDMTAEYLAYLFEHGHPEILTPLLEAGIKSYNAAGSEFLGGFFSDLIAKSPDEFLRAVRTFPPATQGRMCYLAGTADGGGMAPDNLKKVREELGSMKDQVARRCLRKIEDANKLQ
jgi:hypothetical protein